MRFKAAESGVGMTFSPLIGVKAPKKRRRVCSAPRREGGGAGGGAVRSAAERVPRFKAEQKTTIVIAMLIIA